MPLVIDACVAQHQGDRKEQQDRVALLEHPRESCVALAMVADGMGGHTGGILAAQQVIHTARTNFERYSPQFETPGNVLNTIFNEAHILIKASRFINEKDPHSTAVMMLLQTGKASWAHCGDSRFYRFHGDQFLFHTADHSFVEQLVAKGRITPKQALVHPNRNVLTTSLGGKSVPKIDFGEATDLRAGDIFMLCSDGLWAYFDDAEFGAILSAYSAREASDILITQARNRARGAGDNISIAVLKLVETLGKTEPKKSE